MSRSLNPRQKAALVVVASSIPLGYAWLRSKHPTLWQDLVQFNSLRRLAKSAEQLSRSKTSLVDLFERQARERPEQACILYQSETYTFHEVAHNANRTARWVSGSDPALRKDDAVCVLLHNGPTFVWTWLGLMKLGLVASFINYNLKGAALLHCIRVSDAKKLIFGSEFLGMVIDILPQLREMGLGLWMINDARIPGLTPPSDMVTMEIGTASGDQFPNTPIGSFKDVCCCVFTSGTTGMPKAAIVPHSRPVLNCILSTMSMGLGPDDVFYISMPMYHTSALMFFSGCIGTGATIAISKKFSASRFWDDVRRFGASRILYIGEMCRYLLAQPKKDNDGHYPRPVRYAIGNGLRPDIWREFQSRFNIGCIREFYGATDGAFTTVNFDGHVGSVGKYSWLMKKFLDVLEIVEYDYNTGEAKRGPDGLCVRLPPGESGLMLVQLTPRRQFAGYRGAQDLTEKRLIQDVKRPGDTYLNTGDLMRIEADGHIFFVDRLGDTFRWKGENVSTQEVANVLCTFPNISEANVYGVEIPGHEGRAGMAAVIFRSGVDPDFHSLYDHVASALPDYARPKFLRLVKEMVITGTYKLRKVELVKKGFEQDGTSEVFIIDPSQKTYVPITEDHLRMITKGQSKL